MKNTILNDEKISFLIKGMADVLPLNGNTAELGVYKGGISRLIACTLSHKKHYAYDTFTGVPNFGEKDNLECGKFDDLDYKEVKKTLDLPNIIIRKGFFPDTILNEKNDVFCFVHFDGDTYESCISCMNFFYPRLVQNARIYFDDYNRPKCPGVKKALDEFLADKVEKITVTTMGQGLLIKE